MSANKDKSLKFKIHEIIFEADTPLGKYFDVALIVLIFASVITVLLESVPYYHDNYLDLFMALEWAFTFFFTAEYILRLYSVLKPWKYATSFFGVVDLLSILPTYISIFFAGTHSLMVIRAIRLLRIFRIFKMVSFLADAEYISKALFNARRKIMVFLFAILLIVTIMGSLMYLIEGNATNSAFDSIPRSIYWAIVTLTTVGYGDISPSTSLGQFIAAGLMILGYAVIAVPTGIVTNELTKTTKKKTSTQSCKTCSREDHDYDAIFCKYCGHHIDGSDL